MTGQGWVLAKCNSALEGVLAPLDASQAALGIFGPVRGLPGGREGSPLSSQPHGKPWRFSRTPRAGVSRSEKGLRPQLALGVPGLRSRSRKVRMTPQDFAQEFGKGLCFPWGQITPARGAYGSWSPSGARECPKESRLRAPLPQRHRPLPPSSSPGALTPRADPRPSA